VAPAARRRNAKLSFAFVFPDKNGRFKVQEVNLLSMWLLLITLVTAMVFFMCIYNNIYLILNAMCCVLLFLGELFTIMIVSH